MRSFLCLLNSNDQQTGDTFYVKSPSHVGAQEQNHLPNLATSQSLQHVNVRKELYTRKVSACPHPSEVSYCDQCKKCPRIGTYCT